ncbi:paraquat-inducible protein A [Alteromonas sp. 009811495]|uniref:paraquat-inducible protein A n=1 Tax=Alteromonas sp. 009811495 TaxID=3002962 RepID=UPI00237DA86B|nr:paraquat-inducible protein A [Alteromonas sp. 009811495]WDT87436.1 paraquat-inducible protein A [Alteromonas sp. 009811495]
MEHTDNLTLVCEQCHTSVKIPSLSHRQRAVCPVCNHTLVSFRNQASEKMLAYSFSAFIFLLLSLPFNFLTFKASGQKHSIDLPTGITVLIEQDYLSLAIITSLATVLLPGIVIVGIFLLSLAQIKQQRPFYLNRLFRLVKALLPWSMAEIFLVGTLVSLIKITELADVAIGMSFYAFIGFSALTALCISQFDVTRYQMWLSQGVPPSPKPLSETQASESIQRTWALLITACILYIPANVLPIMYTELFGQETPNTIIGGVISLWESGSYPVAIVILIASVVVPVAKIVILAWLNFSVQRQKTSSKQLRIRYYRITEAIGRWSMIDVFVVAVLVALIQMGNTLSIYPGQAALAFCAVVFVTMIAAMTFDSRLIWQQWKQLP